MAKKGKSKGSSGTLTESTETVNQSPQPDAVGANFSQLPSEQIERLRDAFQLIDQDNDGFVSEKDIKATYKSISKDIKDDEVKAMLNGKTDDGKLTFPAYLSLMSKEIAQLPNKSEIQKALRVFSSDMEINLKDLRESLAAVGMKKEELEPVLSAFKTERMDGEVMFMGGNFMSYVS
ncbi:CYFA0S03e06546g1_1 [Cyberlindnera fabianii]|uniref:CYFA0S03e06546g1_1 n=1 Tax=Cyberlindnera fabianii TaxID=36022 RepID=A0A061AWE2_CYBFA|nr:CYFA0S03e06546g1_1 [Cyberlindnera fabianii]